MKLAAPRLAVAGAAVLLLTIAGIGVASAAPPAQPVPTAATDRDALAASDLTASDLTGAGVVLDAPRLRQLLGRRLVHAEVVVDRGDKGIVTFQLDRGTISTKGATSITVAEAGNRAETVATSDTTRVRKDRAKATLADLKIGDQVVVMSKVKAGTAEAYLIVVPPARLVQPAAGATAAP